MNKIRKNNFWNLAGSIFPITIGLFSIPILLKTIGVERFGILTLIWSLIGYFSLFDFGIGRALTQGVSKGLASKSISEIYNLMYAGLKLTLITGFVGGLIMASLSHSLSFYWLNASPNLHLEIFYSILITSVGIPIVSYTSGLRGILEGYEDFQSINIIKIILGALNFMIPMLSALVLGSSLIYIAVSLLLTRILVLFLHFFYLNKTVRMSQIYSKGKVISRKTLLEIYKFGSWMTISNVLSSLMVNADRFLLSYLLGAATIAYYTVPFDLAIRALIVPAAFSATLFPRFSNLISSNPEEAWNLLNISKQKMLKVMLFICGLIVLFSYQGLSFWINSDFANKSWFYLCILSLGIFFNGLSNLPYAFLQAYGKVKLTALLHMIEFIVYMIVLCFLVKTFGIAGAAYAFLIRVFIDYVLLNMYTKKINLY